MRRIITLLVCMCLIAGCESDDHGEAANEPTANILIGPEVILDETNMPSPEAETHDEIVTDVFWYESEVVVGELYLDPSLTNGLPDPTIVGIHSEEVFCGIYSNIYLVQVIDGVEQRELVETYVLGVTECE